MGNTRACASSAIVFILLLFLGLFLAMAFDSDFGKIEVGAVIVRDGEKELSGLLYRPHSASVGSPLPGIVIAHGISGSKEMMSSVGLELSRRGIVTLCLDLFGHGKSRGTVEDGAQDPTFGVLAAVEYLKNQPFVDSAKVGLIGHSLGAGAVRAVVAKEDQIEALVLIAGGLGDIVENLDYIRFNTTFPKNLLVIVGKHDVLFNLTEVTTEELPQIFGTQREVMQDVTYGSFAAKTARRFVMPATTHLFEIFDAKAIQEVVGWMRNSMISQADAVTEDSLGMIYIYRELAILFGLVGLFGVVFLTIFPVSRRLRFEASATIPTNEARSQVWKRQALWGVLNIVLFLPMLAAGLAIPFPLLLFGRSIAWWMLAVGLAGILIFTAKFVKFSGEIGLKERLKSTMSGKNLIMVLVLFFVFFTFVGFIEILFGFNFRIITPLFRILTDSRRILAFFGFLPFFLAYFWGEGTYFFERRSVEGQGKIAALKEYIMDVFAKIGPFLALICFQYLPKLLFDFWILPGFAGFTFEFLWLIVPIFVITTTCAWWFYRNTGNIGAGVMFNTLLMAWVAASVFPF